MREPTMAGSCGGSPPDLVILLYHASQICTYLFETFLKNFYCSRTNLRGGAENPYKAIQAESAASSFRDITAFDPPLLT